MIKDLPKLLANDPALSSQEELEESSALTKRLQRMRKLQSENARLEKQLATLQSKMNDLSPVQERERKLKKRGSPPDPDYVTKIIV